MAYDIRFDVTQTGAGTIDQITSKMAVMKAQITATALEIRQSAARVADAQKQVEAGTTALSGVLAKECAELEALTAKQREQKSALDAMKAATDSAAASAKKHQAAIAELGDAHAKMVPQVAAASGAIRVLEGAMPIRAVERFAVNILGLGPILQAAFPIIGLVAFGEILSSTFGKFDPFIQAEKKLEESNKALDKSFEDLGKRIDRLNVKRATEQLGAAAGAQLAAYYAGLSADEKNAAADAKQPQVDKARKDAAGYTAIANLLAKAAPGSGISEIYRRYAAASDDDARRLSDQQSYLRQESKVDVTEAQTEADTAKKEQQKRAAEQTYERVSKANRDFEEKRRTINSFGLRALSPVEQIYARRDEAAQNLGIRGSDRDELDANANAEVQTELKKQTEEQRKYPLTLSGSRLPATGYQYKSKANTLGPEGENDLKRAGEIVRSNLKDYNTQHNKQVSESGTEAVRANASQGAFADRMTGLNPALSDAQKIVALGQQDLATAQEKYRIELESASALATAAEREDATHKADLSNEQELQKIKEENLERIAELENKHIEEFRSVIGGLFDAVTSRAPNAITNFAKSQVLGVGKTIVENAATTYLLPTLTKLIPHASGVLKNTPFGADPLKTSAAPALVTAAQQLMGAARALAMSRSGGGGGFAGGAAASGSAGVDSDGNPLPGGDIGDGLPMASGQWGSTGSPIVPSNVSASPAGFGFNTGTIASIAGAAAGGVVAAKDFATGGVGKDLQGAGAVAGAAAGLIPLLATVVPALAGPLAPAVAAVAAFALPMIGSLFDGPQRRANAISTELGAAQYVAPQALNATQDSSGNFADFDVRGNLRTSNFSAIPQVREGSTWEQTHGLFGGPPTFYNVPGGQSSQFGATKPATPSITLNVNAIDTQSGLDFLDKNHVAVGRAAAKSMQNIHGALTTEVQRAAAG
ncbi:MAG TPA: hypothetical protein VHY84_27400 [Bryobacteraceae bacterium]|jgi:hypothetical protein|nr:hypothetical protein [Bryobacteraceae bacterium]